MTRALAGILCIALVAVPVRGPARGAASSASRREVEALAERINRHRVAIGCRALARDRRLDALALRHSEDMVRRGFFDHVNPDGRDPFDRMRVAGIRYRAAAENIAEGQQTGRQTYHDWIHSPGHRRNIENCEYTHFGIGLYRSAWTLELVRYVRE